MLLYGDTPPSGEPTLELVRRPLPSTGDSTSAAHEIIERLLDRWGWTGAVEPVEACVDAVLGGFDDEGDGAGTGRGGETPSAVELVAFRRAHQVTVEVHHFGAGSAVPRTAPVADARAALWGVRPLQDGEAVWFEFR
jgi:hypothetical protein